MKQRKQRELGELGEMLAVRLFLPSCTREYRSDGEDERDGVMREMGEMRKSCSRVITEASVCRGGFRD